MTIVPTPYGFWETLRTLGRMAVGPSRANPAGVAYVPCEARINSVEPRVKIGFLGDIMAMSAGLWGRRRSFRTTLYNLVVQDDVRELISDCDALVGNFEGAFSDTKRFFVDQAHHPSILSALAGMFPPDRTYLSVANNHSADFGKAAFDQTLATLAEAGFEVFGSAARPTVEVAPGVRVTAGTMWLNRPCDFVASFADAVRSVQPGCANILFPHWGYELEAFPRRETVKLAESLVDSFEAIVGHHSHTPQPISVLTGRDGRVRPVAFSLGNFCFGVAASPYRHGQILVLEVGTTQHGQWAVGSVQWSFLHNQHDASDVCVGLCDSVPDLGVHALGPKPRTG